MIESIMYAFVIYFKQMISAEAPVLFAKAAEIFIAELTLRAWIHAEDNKRRTLQVLSLHCVAYVLRRATNRLNTI